MKSIEPAELFAYLDKEVSPERMIEIEMALQSDAVVRSEFEKLQASHLEWQAAARTLMFSPQITLPANRWHSPSPSLIAGAVVMLLVLRFVPKFTDVLLIAVLLHVAALSVILPWVVRMVRQDASGIPLIR